MTHRLFPIYLHSSAFHKRKLALGEDSLEILQQDVPTDSVARDWCDQARSERLMGAFKVHIWCSTGFLVARALVSAPTGARTRSASHDMSQTSRHCTASVFLDFLDWVMFHSERPDQV